MSDTLEPITQHTERPPSPTETTPGIATLFEAFCKEHGVTPVIAAEGPVTKELISAVNILAIRWPLKIEFVKPQG